MENQHILSRGLVAQAIDLLRPTIKLILGPRGPGKRSALHVVVLDPKSGLSMWGGSFGELKRAEWPHMYDEIALGKAQLAYRTKMNSGKVHRAYAHLLEQGDVMHRGGVFHKGLAIGVSGIQSHLDETIAMMIAQMIIALCEDVVDKLRQDDPELDFVPAPEA